MTEGDTLVARFLSNDAPERRRRSINAVESRWLDDQRGVGARFKGRNKLSWLYWSTVATVTAWEPGRTFAFEISPPSRSQWTYALEAVPEGTRVTESMAKDDPQAAPIRLLQRLAGVTDRAAVLRDGMTTTLERLEDAVRTSG